MARVLIVDDSPTEIHIISTMLERNGYEVLSATSGEEGVEMARSQRPDLILMDIVMPGLNGFQATRQIARDPQTAGIPVIIVSSKGQESDKVWGLRQGAKDYIVKPVTEPELLAKVRAVLGG
ncbi:response regulator transcription factor [Inmirania thermothiophila]|uniref:Twitching motility two-component system response regulator PilH n=1 Tax=Inmirania thermothiophila TaxID=1750597 RepID=A0A3N1Y5T8_9GAMM|nr:response regulator [Inmirania thermothiophila]ROR34175.1 twitching motility two-component system response regulator PilH [Inmirania thermothiophila]